MSWQGIEGHDAVVEQFRRALTRGRLASTFLFVGPPGVGKRAFARQLAKTLLCSESPPERMAPCGRCPSCQQVDARTHPDLFEIAKPEDRSFIPIKLLIGEDESRMKEGLCHDISLKPFMGGRRIAILDDAEYLNAEGANCLLKTLEEPPPQSVLILIAASAESILPTIRSRSQIIRFAPLPQDVLAQLILKLEIADDSKQAQRLGEYSGGSLHRARELADPELWTFRRDLLAQLAPANGDSPALAKSVIAFVEAAGKEAPPRRARLRQVINFAAEFYRSQARQISGAAPEADVDLQSALVSGAWQQDAELSSACGLRCLEALEQIDRNANQNTLIECWIDDLSQLQAGRLLSASEL